MSRSRRKPLSTDEIKTLLNDIETWHHEQISLVRRGADQARINAVGDRVDKAFARLFALVEHMGATEFAGLVDVVNRCRRTERDPGRWLILLRGLYAEYVAVAEEEYRSENPAILRILGRLSPEDRQAIGMPTGGRP